MKFGDTLRSRSIAEWGHYNIDYDYLKELIKHQTTPGTNKAVSIPGQGESSERDFRATFLHELEAQHDRINLFIRSKSGEIERRLDHIGDSLDQLHAKRRKTAPGSALPVRIVERYAKIEADITKTGEEIRSLSRFRAAQQTGFIKILKKYRRWTKDRELSHDFKRDISGQPDSFFRLDLGYLLDQYTDVLGTLRAVFDSESGSASDLDNSNNQTPAARITRWLRQNDELDFDLALSTVPLGASGNKATYWIHPDHVVEAQVLLLQHFRLFPKYSSSAHASHAPTPQRKPSTANTERSLEKGDDVGLIVLDHAEAFAIKQNASTISSGESSKGIVNIRAAGNVRCVSSGKAAVAVCTDTSCQQPNSMCRIKTAKVNAKNLVEYLESSMQTSTESSDKQNKSQSATEDTDEVKRWLAEHPETRPIVGVGSKRIRFIGLQNNSAGGIWATLDRDVYMKGSFAEDLTSDDWPAATHTRSTAFPHAILEIRREGAQATSLIQTLDKSHLVERVRGFSIEAHAVWVCCRPSSMVSPFWMPLLEQDIRKLPELPKRRSCRKSKSTLTVGSLSQSSPPHTSTSNTSHDGQISPLASRNGDTSATSVTAFVDPPSLQAFRKKRRKPYSDYPPPIAVAEQDEEAPRYWNEYDHPEEEDAGGYYIYVDPDAPVKFPGQELVEALVNGTKRLFGMRGTADDASISAAEDDGSSDDDSSEESPLAGYGTMLNGRAQHSHEGYFSNLFRSFRNPYLDAEALEERRSLLSELQVRQHKTEMTKLRFYSTCLLSAIVIDVILCIMTATSRKRQKGEVDIVVLFGTICTLLLCIIALISMSTRSERLGWVHQGVVMSIATAIVALDVLLICWVFGV